MSDFTCQTCTSVFSIPEATLKKFHNWQPKTCFSCKKTKVSASPARGGKGRSTSREENLTTAQVLEKYTDGPVDGVFTDGSSEPNPGPGGWGAVYVVDNKVVAEAYEHDPATTNNRMELTALIAGCGLVPPGKKTILYTDSKLCVDTVNVWAKSWEARGWKKKQGAIKNLELVQELYRILKIRPELTVAWIAAHSGNRWNEYADALATAYRRKEV